MDFGDYTPSPGRKIPWKLLSLIGGGVVIGVVIILVVMSMIKKSDESKKGDVANIPNGSFKTTENGVPATDVIHCENASDKELCNQLATKQSAEETKNVSLCEKLDAVQKEDCIWGVANAKQDETLCEKLQNETSKAGCINSILFKKATSAFKIGLCDKIPDDSTKEGCRDYILGPITAENCSSRGKDAVRCASIMEAEREKEAQDAAFLNDPDFDGLSSNQEQNTYHTDPNNADTDGDGYSDGQEVNSGHDPLKK